MREERRVAKAGLVQARGPSARAGPSLVEVLDAVDVVGRVHGEGDAVQAAVAHHAGEAVGVVGVLRGPEDPLHDGLAADGARLQGFLQGGR